MKKDAIADSLGITSIHELEKAEVVIYDEKSSDIIEHSEDGSLISDIEKAQDNIRSIMETGKDILEEIVELAKQSEKARDYEVAAGIMKTLIDANKDVVELSKKKHDSKIVPNNTTNVTNNNLVVSTADLLKMIKGEK